MKEKGNKHKKGALRLPSYFIRQVLQKKKVKISTKLMVFQY